MTRRYLMVGIVGQEEEPIEFFDELPPAQDDLIEPEAEVDASPFRGKVY